MNPTEEEIDELPPEGPEQIMSEAAIKRAAALSASGVSSVNGLAKKLGVTNYYARKIQTDERFKQLVAEIGDSAVDNAKAATKAALARLANKAVLAIEKNLDKFNLQAAQTVLRSLGLETGEKGDGDKAGGITLILAGQKPEEKKASVVVVQKDNKE